MKKESLTAADTCSEAFLYFDNWMNRYLFADTDRMRQKLLDEGVALASRRRDFMKWLISEDPELALSLAVSEEVLKQLPEEVAGLIERGVSGKGFYGVLAVCGESLAPSGGIGAEKKGSFSGRISREVVFNDLTYRAHVYGRRAGLGTRESLLIHGIAIDDDLALYDTPYQILEGSASRLSFKGRIVARIGDRIETFESVEAFEEVALALVEKEKTVSTARISADVEPEWSWTTGEEPVFVFLVRPSDGSEWTYSPSKAELSAQLAVTSDWFKKTSYGKVWFSPEVTVTSVMDLPGTVEEYKNSFYQLQSDCRAAAVTAGFNPDAFDRWVVMSNSTLVEGAGLAYVEGKFSWVGGSLAGGVVTHEFGHNFGLYHGNFWESKDGVPRSPAGDHLEYGDVDEAMAGVGGQEYNAYHRNQLEWLRHANGDVQVVESSGIFRIFNNVDEFSEGLLRGVVIPVDDGVLHSGVTEPYMDYGLKKLWVSYRKTTNWFSRGATIHVQGQNNDKSQHSIDLTPDSKAADFSDKWDSALLIGRTYSEKHNQFSGIHITPLARGEEIKNDRSHHWLDVQINLGVYEGNQIPVVTLAASTLSVNPLEQVSLTANAVDGDGDTLAFSWSFGDGTFSSDNESVQSKSWSVPGYYKVLITASDGMGGSTNKTLYVSVGGITSETMFSAGLAMETPVQGLIVEEGGSDSSYSIALKRKPDLPVTVTIVSDSQIFTSVDSLIFIPSEWNRPQRVTVMGVDDVEREDKSHLGNIRHQFMTEDTSYKSLAGISLEVEVFDNDSPTITVSAGPGLVEKGAPKNSWFRIERSDASSTTMNEDEIVYFHLGGAASLGEGDFILSGEDLVIYADNLSGSVRIPSGASGVSLSVMAKDDSLSEKNERIVLSIKSDDFYIVGKTKSATIKIEDNDSIDFFTEQFGYSGEVVNLFDLEGKTVTFIPNGSDSYYKAYTNDADVFPTPVFEGVILADGGVLEQALAGGGLDDGHWAVTMPTSFYGLERTEMFLSTNGQITFGNGDNSYRGVLSEDSYFQFGRPRLALLWGDLNPEFGGKISYVRIEDSEKGRFVLTYENVPAFAGSGKACVQVEIWESGKITITWLEAPSSEVLVGLSQGLGFSDSFSQSDLSAYSSLGNMIDKYDEVLSISPFDTWKRKQFRSWPGGAMGEDARDLADPDNDGVVNLLEFAFAADPLDPDRARLPRVEVVEDLLLGEKYLEITYRQRIGGKGVIGVSYKVGGLLYKVEVSDSLESDSWSGGSDKVQQKGDTIDNGDGTVTVTVRVLRPVSAARKQFACVRVSLIE
ncbi:MAG: PKD domain-containing protein [Opitutaceae bacterium]|nr:PKD domain-containing protein [Opitutaceae bacterium]